MIYNASIIVPTLCPLQFKDVENTTELTHYPDAFRYVQKFGISKTIHVQFHFNSDPSTGAVTINVFNAATDAPICDGGIPMTYLGGNFRGIYATSAALISANPNHSFTYIVSADGKSYSWNGSTFVVGATAVQYTELSAGHWYGDYYIPCYQLSGVVYFTVTSSQGLMLTSWPVEIGNTGDMVELTVWHPENDFQTVFSTEFQGTGCFSIYVEGGFRPDGYTPSGDFDSFSNQFSEDTLTYSMPFDIEKLTLGDANGLPRWMGQKINAYLACAVVLIDGFQWSRQGNLTVEYTGKLTGIYSIDLKPYTNRLTQTIAGDILITNEEATVITTEAEDALALSKTTDLWP